METKEKKIISENNNIPRTKMQIDEAALQSIEPAAVLDSAIVPIRDFVSPEELHRDLIEIIQKYHPGIFMYYTELIIDVTIISVSLSNTNVF